MEQPQVEADEHEEVQKREQQQVLVEGGAHEVGQQQVGVAVEQVEADHDDAHVVGESLELGGAAQQVADDAVDGHEVEHARGQAEDDEQRLLSVVPAVGHAQRGAEVERASVSSAQTDGGRQLRLVEQAQVAVLRA